jgi:hypothetical protein
MTSAPANVVNEPSEQGGARRPWTEGRATLHRLVRWIATTLAITAAILVALVFLLDRPTWWKGLAGATVISAASALVSLPPLAIGLSRSLNGALAGLVVSTVLRAMVAIGGAVAAVKASSYPPVPTLTLMLVFYVALLAAESYVMATALWNSKG